MTLGLLPRGALERVERIPRRRVAVRRRDRMALQDLAGDHVTVNRLARGGVARRDAMISCDLEDRTLDRIVVELLDWRALAVIDVREPVPAEQPPHSQRL